MDAYQRGEVCQLCGQFHNQARDTAVGQHGEADPVTGEYCGGYQAHELLGQDAEADAGAGADAQRVGLDDERAGQTDQPVEGLHHARAGVTGRHHERHARGGERGMRPQKRTKAYIGAIGLDDDVIKEKEMKLKGEPKLVEIYNPAGLVRIEVYDEDGEFFMDVLWDPNDEQTPANKEQFRKWVNQVIKRYQ